MGSVSEPGSLRLALVYIGAGGADAAYALESADGSGGADAA